MEFDGETLTIGMNMTMEEIREFEQFVRPRLEYIQTINVDESSPLQSSALLSLLMSLKRTRNDLKIPFLEKSSIVSGSYGTLHWIYHD